MINEEILVEESLNGNIRSLEKLILVYQKKVFNLSLKFLWNPEDAEDATQEIFIKIITKLNSFRRESSFSTWLYRIAVNHLLNYKKSKQESKKITFKLISKELEKNSTIPEQKENLEELVNTVKSACTNAMLIALKREHRIAFLLGEVFQMKSPEAAEIMQITDVNFRKKLSRARLRMKEFMNTNCGVYNSSNTCRCKNRIHYSIQDGKLNSYLELSENLKQRKLWKEWEEFPKPIIEISNLASIYISTNHFDTRKDLTLELKKILSNKESI
jgi:RNA polymerase sigma factor (sigma-70 family)